MTLSEGEVEFRWGEGMVGLKEPERLSEWQIGGKGKGRNVGRHN